MVQTLASAYREMPPIGGREPVQANALLPMIKSLKMATEAYLEVETIRHASVALHFQNEKPHTTAMHADMTVLTAKQSCPIACPRDFHVGFDWGNVDAK